MNVLKKLPKNMIITLHIDYLIGINTKKAALRQLFNKGSRLFLNKSKGNSLSMIIYLDQVGACCQPRDINCPVGRSA